MAKYTTSNSERAALAENAVMRSRVSNGHRQDAPPAWRRTKMACLLALTLSAAAGAGQPVFTPQDFERSMKAAGRHMELAHTAITAGDFETAKMRVARTREQVSP